MHYQRTVLPSSAFLIDADFHNPVTPSRKRYVAQLPVKTSFELTELLSTGSAETQCPVGEPKTLPIPTSDHLTEPSIATPPNLPIKHSTLPITSPNSTAILPRLLEQAIEHRPSIILLAELSRASRLASPTSKLWVRPSTFRPNFSAPTAYFATATYT